MVAGRMYGVKRSGSVYYPIRITGGGVYFAKKRTFDECG